MRDSELNIQVEEVVRGAWRHTEWYALLQFVT